MIMPLWLFILLIMAAAIIGAAIGSFAVLMLWLSALHKTRGSRQRR
jgi:hypothetical protein